MYDSVVDYHQGMNMLALFMLKISCKRRFPEFEQLRHATQGSMSKQDIDNLCQVANETNNDHKEFDEVLAFYLLVQFMQGSEVKWKRMFEPGYPLLKQTFESITHCLREEESQLLGFLYQESMEVIDNPISGIFAGMIMTAFINDLNAFSDHNSQEKLFQLVEAIMLNGGVTTLIVAVVKMMQLMKDKIVDHESFDVVIYCKQ